MCEMPNHLSRCDTAKHLRYTYSLRCWEDGPRQGCHLDTRLLPLQFPLLSPFGELEL